MLHKILKYGRGPRLLLSKGANPDLVGFNLYYSPLCETPISLSMYRVNTFVNLRDALKDTAADFETGLDQTLEIKSLHYFHWTKETWIEMFSEDLDLSPLFYHHDFEECSICLRWKHTMVQPYWMRILMSITSRNASQSIQDVVKMMLPTDSQAGAVSEENHELEVDYLPVQMLKQNKMNPTAEDERLPDIDAESICFSVADEESIELPSACKDSICLSNDNEESFSTQFVNEKLKTSSFYDNISIEEEDICVFCWLEWIKTGSRPPPKREQERLPVVEIDSDDEEDHYSPYHVHT